MIDVRMDLIEQELSGSFNHGLKFKRFKLSKRLIDKLFNHYYCAEWCEHFYDSEPDFEGDDEELYKMYLDYQDRIEITGMSFWSIVNNMDDNGKILGRFSEKEHTPGELKAAYQKVRQMYEDYEETRMVVNNWVEPYFKGNWEYTQKEVDEWARYQLKKTRKISVPHKDRFWIAEDENELRIYFYARDIWRKDLWFIFEKKKDKRKK